MLLNVECFSEMTFSDFVFNQAKVSWEFDCKQNNMTLRKVFDNMVNLRKKERKNRLRQENREW